ncbi:MAG: TolC family protein, partial [Planctomycetes bacterium]|nr:TolC family protein [Planctomycetota bacterium]
GVRVADEAVRSAATHLEMARTRFEAGTVARLDVLRAEVEAAGARAKRIRAASAREIACQGLRAVLALPPGTPVTVEGSLDDVGEVPQRDDLLAAMPSRPDIRALGAQKAMAEQSLSLATAELKPVAALKCPVPGGCVLVALRPEEPQLPAGRRGPGAAAGGAGGRSQTGGGAGADSAGRTRHEGHDGRGHAGSGHLVLGTGIGAGDRGHAAEGARGGARGAVDSRGVLRQRHHHDHRTQRCAAGAARDRVGARPGEVRADCGGGPDAIRRGHPVTSSYPSSKWVRRLKCLNRSLISSWVKRSSRSRLKSSTANDASVLP